MAGRSRRRGHEPSEGEDDRSGTLARLHGRERLDWALGHAATFGRFAEGDLASILAADPPGTWRRVDDVHSMQTGTGAWDGFGTDEDEGAAR